MLAEGRQRLGPDFMNEYSIAGDGGVNLTADAPGVALVLAARAIERRLPSPVDILDPQIPDPTLLNPLRFITPDGDVYLIGDKASVTFMLEMADQFRQEERE
jgi:hypothetical protein